MVRHSVLPVWLQLDGRFLLLLLAWPLILSPLPAQAQSSRPAVWVGTGTAFFGAILLDTRLRVDPTDRGERELESLSEVGNALGRPNVVIPALGLVFGVGGLAGRRELSSAALHTAVALAAAGVVNGVVKTGVGRRRPDADNDASSFRPFSLHDQWQSFPSGHAVVAFSLAAAVAEEAKQPWVSVLTYGAATLVGWSRVYEDRHWASDVVGGAAIGTAASKLTLRWLHARAPHAGEKGSAAPPVQLSLLPGGFAVAILPPR